MVSARTGITAVGGRQTAFSTKSTMLEINSMIFPNQTLHVHALVIRRLNITSPSTVIPRRSLSHIEDLPLADPDYNKPGSIEIILGANCYQDLMLSGVIHGESRSPIAQETRLGWIVSGAAPMRQDRRNPHSNVISCSVTTTEHRHPFQDLSQFWELEEVSAYAPRSEDDEKCERLFNDAHERRLDGRYMVRLPITPLSETASVSSTLRAALAALQGVRRRMDRDQEFKAQYEEFMRDYEMLGHMSPICQSEVVRAQPDGGVQYLPHHGIWQKADHGRKLRVVFDASRICGSAATLNERLRTGPSLQADVIAIMMRWREPRIVFCADIQMMYRQILVHPEDTNLQRIVWQRPGENKVQHFRLLTLTYGTRCAPYLAIRTLRQLAMDDGHRFPDAAEALLRDTYVDDVLSGAEDVDSAIHLKNQLVELLKGGGFHLRKWASNEPQILQDIPVHDRLRPVWRDFMNENPIQTLGVSWDPIADEFRFRTNLTSDRSMTTKRQVLSIIARLHDPMGWLAPVLLIAKVLMQSVWKSGISWDDPLPHDLERRWSQFTVDLPNINKCSLPRWIGSTIAGISELHGFADASKHAYAAAVYLVTQDHQGKRSSCLMIAKTKVAPIKTISIPRLELCAAVLLSRLLCRVATELRNVPAATHARTDSNIVLAWIQSDPSRWNVFVANRVAEIQHNLPRVTWSHVRSTENPADIASRGMLPSSLQRSSLWWNGPHWLTDFTQSHSVHSISEDVELPSEELARKTESLVLNCSLNNIERADGFIDRFSSLVRLERVVAQCLRIVKRRRPDVRRQLNNWLSAQELEEAFLRCVLCSQRAYFEKELDALTAGRAVPSGSPLRPLSPFLDKQGIIRVGGRLQETSLPYSQRHPVILPKNARLSDLLIDWAHRCALHGGHNLTYSYVLRRAWIVRGRVRVRATLRRCPTCVRANARPLAQVMGNLPLERVTPARPFAKTGLDYAGPIKIKASRGRGVRSYKGYLAIFVCLCTKAVHIEVVGDLTTQSFLGAVRRFSSRRGSPQELWSDNATTFRGADAELRALLQEACLEWPEIATQLAAQGISWRFIPPSAPHFGGLWEAAVKIAKAHLKRIIGTQLLTYEELITFTTQIEGAMNSRPLTPLSGLPDDLEILTPGHFLVGGSLTHIPEPSATQCLDHLTHWRLVQGMFHHFWERWAREYLHTLQQRLKWTRKTTNLKEGDMVFILDSTLMRQHRWPLGTVTSVHPGADGFVRTATIRTASGIYDRPITKLALLPISQSQSSTE